MGALPNTLPQTPRKPAAKATKSAKLNKYGRDPGSATERMRPSSDYDAGTGYAPFFHAFLADWSRLSSGHIADIMFMAALSKSLGRSVKKGDPRASRTLPIAKADLAALINPKNPPLRSVERELARWHAEKIAEVKDEGKGLVSIELLYRGWEALPDFKSDVVEMPGPVDEVELTEEDEAKPGNQRVTGKRPVRIAAGSSTKAYQVTTGIREWQGRVEGPVDCEVSTVVKAGRCETVIKFPDDWLEKVKKSLSTSNVSNDLTSGTRHGCRDEVAKTGRKVNHHRAGELCDLFDPFLSKQAVGLLCMDQSSLLKACQAIRDIDHDYLVKFVVQRAETPIRSSKHVPAICEDAYQSWQASKVLKRAGAVSQEDIDAMVKQDLAELARKKKELAQSRSRK
jgi:hypothetical protein